MEIRCINLEDYKKNHKHELTAKEFSNMETDKKTLMDKSFVGQSMEGYRCTLLFPAKDKKLVDIFKVLRSFSKIGFHKIDPAGKGTSRHTDVEIQLKSFRHKFRMELDLSNGQIGIHNMQNQKFPYLDKEGQTGCFCKLHNAVELVSFFKYFVRVCVHCES